MAASLTSPKRLLKWDVSRQLGHADACITLKVYTHLFDAALGASDRLAASYAEVIQPRGVPQRVPDLPSTAPLSTEARKRVGLATSVSAN